jgi:hypothetical protein
MNQAIWLLLAALFLAPVASSSATKDQSPPDKEMLKMLEFLRDMEMIKQLDMMQDLHNVEAAGDQAKNNPAPKSVPGRKKESAK